MLYNDPCSKLNNTYAINNISFLCIIIIDHHLCHANFLTYSAAYVISIKPHYYMRNEPICHSKARFFYSIGLRSFY